MLAMLLRIWVSQTKEPAPEEWLAACEQKGIWTDAQIPRAVQKMHH